jgi:phage tail-like protein
MKEREFKTQVFDTAGQWGSGLFVGLEAPGASGITIPSLPSLATRLEEITGIASPLALAADGCGILYLLDAVSHHVYRHDPEMGVSERIFCPGKLDQPRRILLDGLRLWLADTATGQVKSCSLENFQLILSIDLIEEPLDITVNCEGELYVLDGKTNLLHRFDRHGSKLGHFGSPYLKDPVGCTMGTENVLVVLDRNSGLLKFSREGELLSPPVNLDGIVPVWLAGNALRTIFVLSEAGQVYQFDQAGVAAGMVEFPSDAGKVLWITADHRGHLYASTGQDVFRLDSGKTFTKKKGFFYSRTLDSGIKACTWHRLVLTAELPPGTTVDIYSYASDDTGLKNLVEGALADTTKTVLQKADVLDQVIPWVGPEPNAQDMLFRLQSGRFFWVKLALATFDDKVRPVVSRMKILYPRISYLRYLPAIFQEDPVSRNFLERFLSLYESIFYDLETDISTVTRYFDADTTPPGFLKWLASWVNLAIDDDWPENTKRKFIRQAAHLYTIKGTVEGIRRFIEIYTGKIPTILESSGAWKPVVLGGSSHLGIDSLLLGTPIRGFRLGDDSILSRVALRDVVQSAEDPFLPLAYRFTVVIDLTQEERARLEKGLKKIITDVKPAHTAFSLRFAGGLRAGLASVGISSSVGGFDPLRLGSSTVGASVLLSPEEGGKVGERSVLGVDTRLTS